MPVDRNIAQFRFEGKLNDFLPESQRNQTIQIPFRLNPSVKDLIEAQGVPHVEIFGIRVNGKWRVFDYTVRHNDEVVVLPKESMKAAGEHALKPVDAMPSHFIADVHLGKLVRLLRLMGVDTLYDRQYGDREIVSRAVHQERAALSRDTGLLKRGDLVYGYWPRSTDPDRQVIEVLSYFDLGPRMDPFTRCLTCNGVLEQARPADVEDEVPEGVKSWSEEYRRCRKCRNIYWKGSHYEELRRTADTIRERLARYS